MSGVMVGGRTFGAWLKARRMWRGPGEEDLGALRGAWAAGLWPGVVLP